MKRLDTKIKVRMLNKYNIYSFFHLKSNKDLNFLLSEIFIYERHNLSMKKKIRER